MEIECLYSGNVAESQAIDFYNRASLIVQEATYKAKHGILDTTAANGSHTVTWWIPEKKTPQTRIMDNYLDCFFKWMPSKASSPS
jgi:hypothetical protein